MSTTFKDVTVKFGLGPDSSPIEIDGVQVGGILKNFKFEAGQTICHTATLELYCQHIEFNNRCAVMIDDVEIRDEDLAREICHKIVDKYGDDIKKRQRDAIFESMCKSALEWWESNIDHVSDKPFFISVAEQYKGC